MMPSTNWNPTSRELRQFAVVIAAGFGVIGGMTAWKGHLTAAHWVWCISGSIAVLTLAVPRAGLPFYRIWMAVGLAMGRVTSRIVLALLFYGLITPLAILFRVIGRDSLRRGKPDPNVKSYWQVHPEISRKNYGQLF